MAQYGIMIFSGLFYGFFLLCMAAFSMPGVSGTARRLPRSAGKPGRRLWAWGELACAVALFFFIPPGSLPPFVDSAWGGLAALALLGSSWLCSCAGQRHGRFASAPLSHAIVSSLAVPAFFAATLCVLAVYARQRGMPGEVLNLGSYAAMPLWGLTALWGRLGLACLGCALFVCAVGGRALDMKAVAAGREGGVLACSLRLLALAAILVCLFAPWLPGRMTGFRGALLFSLDAVVFWAKTVALAWCISGCAKKISGPLSGRYYAGGCLLALAGTLLLLFDTGRYAAGAGL